MYVFAFKKTYSQLCKIVINVVYLFDMLLIVLIVLYDDFDDDDVELMLTF